MYKSPFISTDYINNIKFNYYLKVNSLLSISLKILNARPQVAHKKLNIFLKYRLHAEVFNF